MDQTSTQERAKWVERWKDSGLTAKEFAAEVGLQASALYYWRSQLSAAVQKGSAGCDESAKHSEQTRQTRAARPVRQSARRSPRFVELPVAAVASAPAMLELVLGDVCVRVPSGFDEATLTRVVRALGVAR